VTDPLLAFEHVDRIYRDGRLRALADVSLSVAPGEYAAVTGPSGSGKSTLLHLSAGLDYPTGGRLLFDGRAPRAGREWARLRAERIGFVFQAFNLLPRLSALENVEVPMMGVVRGFGRRRERARDLLRRVGLSDRAGHRPGELSAGERQRVAIARGLANGPALLLADEPTGNLDTATAAGILDLLEEIHTRDGTTLIIVTHDAATACRADRIVGLLDGRIVSDTRKDGGAP
jgi:putative ABC transport system ATP-binding protein